MELKKKRQIDGANAPMRTRAHTLSRWHTGSEWSPHSCTVSDLLELFFPSLTRFVAEDRRRFLAFFRPSDIFF